MARILLYTDLPSGQVDLVRASHATELSGAMREDAAVVSVTRDGGVYLDSQAIPLGQLPNEIWKHFNAGAEKKVYVKADARAKYADVAAALDVLRAAKVQHIALITD